MADFTELEKSISDKRNDKIERIDSILKHVWTTIDRDAPCLSGQIFKPGEVKSSIMEARQLLREL